MTNVICQLPVAWFEIDENALRLIAAGGSPVTHAIRSLCPYNTRIKKRPYPSAI